MPVYEAEAPGVIVEIVPVTPSISGVGTSTAALIGVSTGGSMPIGPDGVAFTLAPVDVPQIVTSFDQFTRLFGNTDAGNKTLALSVRGFFGNGGSRCWVTRVNDLDNTNDVGKALKALEAIDEVAIVAAPGALLDGVQLAIIEHCAGTMKDRFAILDGQDVTTVTTADIKGALISTSDWAAMYFPFVQVSDPTDATGRGKVMIPPSGLMAGIYARVDTERGVHKAPANVVVRGALGLAHQTSKNEQAGVNKDGINVIRMMNNEIRVWGARTMGPDKIKYINVRRLLIFLSESLDEGTQYAVFEPNANPLWQAITRSISAFLTRVWRDGALFGVVPEQAFYVKCDESTNPAINRDAGVLIAEIGVAPVKPAEFVVLRIQQFTEIPTS